MFWEDLSLSSQNMKLMKCFFEPSILWKEDKKVLMSMAKDILGVVTILILNLPEIFDLNSAPEWSVETIFPYLKL